MKARIVFGENGKPNRYYLDGEEVTKKAFNKAMKPVASSAGPSSLIGWKPLHSEALAYHPKQIAEAREHLAKIGVPTDIDEEGRPIFRSRQHRAEFLRKNGYYDRDAGYGDPANGSFRGSDQAPVEPEMFKGEGL